MKPKSSSYSRSDFQSMRSNNSCTLIALPSPAPGCINVYSVINDCGLAIQYSIDASAHIDGSARDRFDFVSVGAADFLAVLGRDALLVYALPLKRDIGFSALHSAPSAALPFAAGGAPHHLRVSRFGCGLYFGYLCGAHAVIAHLDLASPARPLVREVRRLHHSDGFVWFDFVRDDDVYLATPRAVFRARAHLPQRALSDSDSLFTSRGLSISSACVCPADPSQLALCGRSDGKCVAGVLRGGRFAAVPLLSEARALQWSSYGAVLYAIGDAYTQPIDTAQISKY